MSTRYQLWDKESQVITPIGEVLTAGQWMERYPAGGGDSLRAGRRGGERGVLHTPCPDEADLRPAGVRLLRLRDRPGGAGRHRSLRGRAERPRRGGLQRGADGHEPGVHRASLEYQNMLTLDDAEVV